MGTEGGARTVRPWARGQSVRVVRRCERWEGVKVGGRCDVDMAGCEDRIVGESGGEYGALLFMWEEIGSSEDTLEPQKGLRINLEGRLQTL